MSISGTIPPHITHLNDIGDVNVPAPIDGYFVYWDATANRWQCRALIDADIPASIARDAEVAAAILAHKGDASAHHAKTGDDEVYGLLRIGLDANKPAPGVAERFYWATDTKILYYDTGAAWVETTRGETVTRLAQLSEKAHSSLTGIGASDHHARYTDAEALAWALVVGG